MTAILTDDPSVADAIPDLDLDMPPEAFIRLDYSAQAKVEKYSLYAIVRQVKREASCGWVTAFITVSMVLRRIAPMRNKGRLSFVEMKVAHHVLNVIMPDYQPAEPGTAHAMLNTRAGIERAFVHGKTLGGFCNCKTVSTIGVSQS